MGDRRARVFTIRQYRELALGDSEYCWVLRAHCAKSLEHVDLRMSLHIRSNGRLAHGKRACEDTGSDRKYAKPLRSGS